LTKFSTLFHSKFEMLINMKVVSLEKLDNFHIGRFLKHLGEIWRTRQKFQRTFKDIRGLTVPLTQG
jgi:hypothetical protein